MSGGAGGSGGSGWFGNFLRSFIDAFLKSSQKSGQSSSQKSGQNPAVKPAPRPRAQGSSSGQATAQSTARPQNSSSRPNQGYDESPGQYGAGATRDLTRDEIRSLTPSYEPSADGDPDPGEIVWTWVPYAENDGRGKDRPVLIIARIDLETTAGCYLSTKEHRGFVSVGSGPWDSQGRESFLAPDRVLRVTHDGMRREGNVLPKDLFGPAVVAVMREHGITG